MQSKRDTILLDTSVWIEYLRGRNLAVKGVVTAIVQSGRASICGVVLAELLAGTRSPSDQERLALLFRGLDYLELDRGGWVSAGTLAASLRAAGITLPMADLLIATLALQHSCALYSLDNHFQRIPDLSLYTPTTPA